MNTRPSAEPDRSCTDGTRGPIPGRGLENAGAVGFSTDWGWTHAYPQPVLSSLVFDIDGYLNLGFTDRTAIQSGNLNVGSDTNLPEPILRDGRQRRHPRRRSGGTRLAPGIGLPDDRDQAVLLACNGKVGSRAVRTAAASGQTPTYNNNQGPATGSSSTTRRPRAPRNDSQRQHPRCVATYPESMKSCRRQSIPSPGSTARVSCGRPAQRIATRGFDQVEGVKSVGSAAFQKGGGLRGVALLAVAAPVEIGNGVWLDADLNGRQDAANRHHRRGRRAVDGR